MNWFLDILTAFGITPDKYPFFFLACLIIIGFIYVRISLGNPLAKVKENIIVIVTHLTSSRAKLNPTLIKQMSPLQIQPEGQKILVDSGFVDFFSNSLNKQKFIDIVLAQKPKTKLDVESYSIYSFLELMTKDGEMNNIKSYLYQHPDIRETFPTLAGVYIRDSYLTEHPEITQ